MTKACKAPFAADIEKYLELDERRKEAARQADALAKEQEPLRELLMNFVKQEGGKEKSKLRSGYLLAIKEAAGFPSWKSEFIKRLGAEAAAEVTASTPPRETLLVQRVG